MTVRQGRTALYRVFDSTGKLLYVGISQNPDIRFGQHSQTKLWWSEVDVRKVEWYETRAEAATAEKVAIKAEMPHWNLHHAVPQISDSEATRIFNEYRAAREEAALLLPIIKEQAVQGMKAGATATQLAELTGISAEVFRRLARDNDVPVAAKYQSRAELLRARKAPAQQPTT